MGGKIRVRMAPSPTGFLHIGTARTALFNWLFARSQGGTFVLRIEDTDRQRSTKEFDQDILDQLRWLGLDWDEGPGKEGKYGPYRQTERLAIYKKYLEQLIAQNQAYRCFCTKEELEAQAQEMTSRGEAPRYRGTCNALTKEQIDANLAKGKPFVIRMRMPNKKVDFDDMIRGKVSFDLSLVGDVTIAKGFEEPLYNFAVVVDDHEMAITHVIRGEDHLSNTPKQIALYEMLGWDIPRFGHLPLILDDKRAKLSKRFAAVSIRDYRAQGYIPEALVNFIILLGWHPSGDKELFTLDELAKEFSISRVQKAGAVFNTKRLDWFNNYYLRKKSSSELMALLEPVFEKTGLLHATKPGTYQNADASDSFDAAYAEQVIALILERAQKLSDIPELTDFFFAMPDYEAKLLQWRDMSPEQVKLKLGSISEALQAIDAAAFSKETVTKAVEALYGTDRGEILWPMRVALSGKQFSPGPFEIAAILGKERVMNRIRQAIEKIPQA